MTTKTCNECLLTLEISEFYKKRGKCKKCLKEKRQQKKCKHNKIKCIICSPQHFCKHKKQKAQCNICNECEHGKRKTYCIKCSPQYFCKHKKLKTNCNICNGCEHGKYKGNCVLCYGCDHGKRKSQCTKCSPQNFCVHKRRKNTCKDCDGSSICEHGSRKYRCIKGNCNGSNICKHKKQKAICRKCNGSSFCKHKIQKSTCNLCNGSAMCIHCKMIQGKKRYVESLDKKILCCIRCFYNFYPNDKIPRRFKCKQHYFNEKLIEEFGVNFFQYDKKIKCGCSGRMPDWFIDCFKYSIIIELDEDQHKYNSCDEKRMMELFQDLGNRNLVLIRINPDKYKGKTKKRKGCFDFDEKNTLICNEKKFNKRFNLLIQKIKYYMDNQPTKELTIERLFFDL